MYIDFIDFLCRRPDPHIFPGFMSADGGKAGQVCFNKWFYAVCFEGTHNKEGKIRSICKPVVIYFIYPAKIDLINILFSRNNICPGIILRFNAVILIAEIILRIR